MMSASPFGRQRLMTVSTCRVFITVITPFEGRTSTSTPAISPTLPAHAPVALTTWRARISSVVPGSRWTRLPGPVSCSISTPTISPSSTSTSVTGA